MGGMELDLGKMENPALVFEGKMAGFTMAVLLSVAIYQRSLLCLLT